MLEKILELLVVVAATAALTGVMRKLALARGVIDKPNLRSSHKIPTPRGGGMAIAASVLAVTAMLGFTGSISRQLAEALLISGPVVAAVGFIDDLRSVSPVTRLAFQFSAFSWCIWCLGSIPPVDFGFGFFSPWVSFPPPLPSCSWSGS